MVRESVNCYSVWYVYISYTGISEWFDEYISSEYTNNCTEEDEEDEEEQVCTVQYIYVHYFDVTVSYIGA